MIPLIAWAFLQQVEPDRHVAYLDSARVATVGRGHTGKGIHRGMKISQAKSDALFRSDVANFSVLIEKQIASPSAVKALSKHQYSALLSFALDVGSLGHRIPVLVRSHNYRAIPTQMIRFNHVRIHGRLHKIPGLVARRAAEVAFFNQEDL